MAIRLSRNDVFVDRQTLWRIISTESVPVGKRQIAAPVDCRYVAVPGRIHIFLAWTISQLSSNNDLFSSTRSIQSRREKRGWRKSDNCPSFIKSFENNCFIGGQVWYFTVVSPTYKAFYYFLWRYRGLSL